jgi:hypothetical protein
MSRGWMGLCIGGLALASFACKDDLVEEVPKDVCYSGLRWVGEKRGDPEMFPGRDCVGCHLENDGPPLAIGGTIYAYTFPNADIKKAQSGADCFGIEGKALTITDADGQTFEVVSNRAGNFFVEGNPDDLAKPFKVKLNDAVNQDGVKAGMATSPMYGGCARCHNPDVPDAVAAGLEFDTSPSDAEYRNGVPRIGLPGYSPTPGGPTVQSELEAFAAAAGAP